MAGIAKSTAVVLMAAGIALVAGCGASRPHRPSATERPSARPRPNLELAGRAEALKIESKALVPRGPGAEGRVGDYLLHNALTRFIVGAAHRQDPSPAYAGAVVDAALYGGGEYMRLLVPQIGDGAHPTVTCERVWVEGPGGPNEAAVVVADGHWAENPAVAVRTAYRLDPHGRSLEITTDVENKSASTLRDVVLGDLVFHGRTERFVERLGLHPFGRRGQATWLSFFVPHRVWAVFAAGRMPFSVEHQRAYSRLTYSEHTIRAGETRTYRRFLVAAAGDPSSIAAELPATGLEALRELSVHVVERGSDRPVEGAYLSFESSLRGAATLALTDGDGRAHVDLPSGRYILKCLAPGRSPFECGLPVDGGTRNQITIELSRRAWLRIRVRESISGRRKPSCARITLRRGGAREELAAGVPFFSPLRAGRTVLVPLWGETVVPLAPGRGGLTEDYVVTASKGPLYELAQQKVSAVPGRTTDVELVLRRVVDPAGYAAVDFGQHTDASPGACLTLAERLLLNACEGLDGAVVMNESVNALAGMRAPRLLPAVVPALRITTPWTGRVSVVPLPVASGEGPIELPPAWVWAADAAQVFAGLRTAYGGSLIQIEAPLAQRVGYFRPAGQHPDGVMGEAFAERFDSICLLTGSDTLAAARTLKHWFHLLNQGSRVLAVGSSESVSVSDTAELATRTYVACPERRARSAHEDVDRAIRALKVQQNAFVSNGPFLRVTVNGQPIGSVVTARGGSVLMHLRVEAPEWMSVVRVKIIRRGVPVRVFDVRDRQGTVVLDRKVELTTSSDCWFVVLAEGEKGMAPVYCDEKGRGAVPFAVTNPFWVDADWDGAVAPLH